MPRIERVHVFYPRRDQIVEAIEARLADREVVLLATVEELAAAMPAIEALLVLRPPRDLWPAARVLRLVQTLGAGVDSVLPAPGLASSVALANARGIAPPAMSEFALALLLALYKGLPTATRRMTERKWRRWLPRELAGSTVAILGLGAIGLALAVKLDALGAQVVGTQRSPKPHPAVAMVYPPVALLEALAAADAVVVLLPLTDQTRGLLDGVALDAMKPGALLVNLARGGILDEGALLERLRDGRIGGAALDVFAREPLPAEDPLWEAPNVLITPHIAGLFAGYEKRLADLFAGNVERVERGEEVVNRIDRERGY